MLPLKHDGPQRPAPALRRHRQIPREVGEAEFDARHVLAQLGAVQVGSVVHFVVNADAGGGAGGGEEVDRDPGEDLVRGPGVGVGPVVEFLVDPTEQGDGAVAEGVPQGLRLGALDLVVAAALLEEPLCSCEAGFFKVAVGGYGVLEGQDRGAGECGWGDGSDVIDMTGCGGCWLVC